MTGIKARYTISILYWSAYMHTCTSKMELCVCVYLTGVVVIVIISELKGFSNIFFPILFFSLKKYVKRKNVYNWTQFNAVTLVYEINVKFNQNSLVYLFSMQLLNICSHTILYSEFSFTYFDFHAFFRFKF